MEKKKNIHYETSSSKLSKRFTRLIQKRILFDRAWLSLRLALNIAGTIGCFYAWFDFPGFLWFEKEKIGDT